MKNSTKFIHKLIQFFKLEPLFICLTFWNKFFYRFIPLNHFYPDHTIRKVKRNRVYFSLDVSDYMQWYVWANMKDISWELAAKAAQPKSCIFDIGANIGAFSLKLAANSTCDNIRIISFEPNPYVFKQLSENLNQNGSLKHQIHIIPLGISNESSELYFEWNKKNSGGGRFVFTKDKSTNNVEKIGLIRLDDYIRENRIDKVKFIKIDVEGFEPFVIKGACKTIKKFLPDLYIEVTPKWWYENGFTVKEVLSFFEENNYEFYPAINEKLQSKATLDDIVDIKYQFNLLLSQSRP